MTVAAVAEGIVGGLLLFFIPGYALAKALFPEWRVRGPGGTRHLVEMVTLSFVTSVGLTVLVGYGVLNLAPGGFAATWTDPVLEVVLAAVALVGFVIAVGRGAFSARPPVRAPLETVPTEEGAWELSRELERLGREERRLERALRSQAADASEVARLKQELEHVRSEREGLRRVREEEYAA